jgi:hypothetical protein
MAREQARAERAQDRGLDARVGHIPGPGVCPVHPRPHGSRRLGVREPVGTRHHGDQRERGRGLRWSSGVRQERGTWWVPRDETERLAPTPRGMPRGARGAGHLDGLLRNDVIGRRVQGQRQPPLVRFASLGYGTTPLIHHTGAGRHGNSVTPGSPPSGVCQRHLVNRGPHKVSAQSGEYSDLTRWCYRTEFPNPLKHATSILCELQEMSLPLQ